MVTKAAMRAEKCYKSHNPSQLYIRYSGTTFSDLPVEIRTQILHPIAISPISQTSTNPHILPRPLACDGQIVSVGCFVRDTIIPLILTYGLVHNDVSTILYGENVFVFHISSLGAEGSVHGDPSWPQAQNTLQSFGLNVFAERYWLLLRRVIVRTGYSVVGLPRVTSSFRWMVRLRAAEKRDLKAQGKATQQNVDARKAHELSASAALVKAAWPPERSGIRVNERDVIAISKCKRGGEGCRWHMDEYGMVYGVDWSELSQNHWPASLGIMWKLADESNNVRKDFRKIVQQCKQTSVSFRPCEYQGKNLNESRRAVEEQAACWRQLAVHKVAVIFGRTRLHCRIISY